jgi:hypothetical protein
VIVLKVKLRQEAKAGGSQVQSQPGLHHKTLSQKNKNQIKTNKNRWGLQEVIGHEGKALRSGLGPL